MYDIHIYIYIYIYIKDHTSLSRTEFSGFKWIICAWADRRMSNLMLSFRESQVSYLIEAKRIYVVTYHQLMMFQCALFIINNILLSWNHCNDTISLYIYFCDSSADRCLMLKMTSQQPDYNPNVIFFVVYGKTGYNNDKKMIRNIESLIVSIRAIHTHNFHTNSSQWYKVYWFRIWNCFLKNKSLLE